MADFRIDKKAKAESKTVSNAIMPSYSGTTMTCVSSAVTTFVSATKYVTPFMSPSATLVHSVAGAAPLFLSINAIISPELTSDLGTKQFIILHLKPSHKLVLLVL